MAEKISDKIKNFFQKKKADSKFKRAGPGYKLTESTQSSTVSTLEKKVTPSPQRSGPSDSRAAEAALARITGHQKDNPFNTSLAAIQAKVKRELEAEKKLSDAHRNNPEPKEIEIETSPHLAVSGVYYKCPLINEQILSKEEWRTRIKEFLFAALEEERGITACLILHSCNYNKPKVSECVNILCKYIDNILKNPTESKFHKIRCSNATFSEKVAPLVGVTEFLYAAGFRLERLKQNDNEEDFWVWNIDNIDGIETLDFLRDALLSEDKVELELDRNLQVLSPSQAAVRIDLPHDFYSLSVEELKKEQQTKSEMIERQMQLRTKAMREKDELREMRKYKFSLIRIRFPDGIYLQGTFAVYEKLSDVVDFVKENLEHSGLPFILSDPTGHRFDDKDFASTLIELRLVPATILIFEWDPNFSTDIKSTGNCMYLKADIMMLMREI